MTKPSATLIIRRKSHFSYSIRKFDIHIDGKKVDTVANGNETALRLAPGIHIAHVAIGYYASKPLEVTLSPGEVVTLVCGLSSAKPLTSWMSKDEYVYMEFALPQDEPAQADAPPAQAVQPVARSLAEETTPACPHCGKPLRPNARFCGSCGQAITAATSADSPRAAAPVETPPGATAALQQKEPPAKPPSTRPRQKGNTIPLQDGKINILFLASDPTDVARLRAGAELREIGEKLQLAKQRERFQLHQRLSVRPEDFSQALLDLAPQIVHFSGHGSASGMLCFEDESGQALAVSGDALATLFEQFSGQVQCVILNACYSEAQAQAIAAWIPYVIGMPQSIGDRAAIAFATGFYQALGAGRTIEAACKLGIAQARMLGAPSEHTPVLIHN